MNPEKSSDKTSIVQRCVRCRSDVGGGFRPFCECGGMVDVEYDLDRVVLFDSEDPLKRFRHLLPVEDAAGLLRLALRSTPCRWSRAIGDALAMPRLYLKDETVLPTRTTKDRMAAVALAFLAERGVRGFCSSSTGNSSTAFARAIGAFPDLRFYCFTAEDFCDRVSYGDSSRVVPFGMRGATFAEASAYAGEFARRHGFTAEQGFFNPGRREGLKLAFLESAEQVPGPIDWYVQAVSSAMGVYATAKAARELVALGRIARLPRLACVQQESCSPMVRAWHDGSETIRPEHVVPRPAGIARAILRGDPSRAYPYVREAVAEGGGTFVAVEEHEIREAHRMLVELEGIPACFSAATALAGAVRLIGDGAIGRGETVLVNLTGGERPLSRSPVDMHWLRRTPDGWATEDSDDAYASMFARNPRDLPSDRRPRATESSDRGGRRGMERGHRPGGDFPIITSVEIDP